MEHQIGFDSEGMMVKTRFVCGELVGVDCFLYGKEYWVLGCCVRSPTGNWEQ